MTIRLGRHITSNRKTAFDREWLVTNGVGGYASGTLGGARTRRYHGLLVAALSEPIARHLLLAALDVWVEVNNRRFPLTTHEWNAGVIFPDGYNHLETFWLDGTIPVFHWSLGYTSIEQRIWMHHGHNTTYISWRLVRGYAPIKLYVKPLITYRNHHDLTQGNTRFNVRAAAPAFTNGVSLDLLAAEYCGVHGPASAPTPFHLHTTDGYFYSTADWWWNFHLAEEKARALDFQEDLFQAGTIEVELGPGEDFALVASAEHTPPEHPQQAFIAEKARQQSILDSTTFTTPPDWIQQLILAADQFIVEDDNTGIKHVITGYPWYGVWGRSTMSSLTGLTTALNNLDCSAAILRGFAQYLDKGMLPNVVNEDGTQRAYNSIDATLWYFVALWAYFRVAPNDSQLLRELYPQLKDVLDWHTRGTRYHIAEDESDGLLFGGEEGVQLTWMDVKIENTVITPRIGKDVEVNALWYNALRIMQQFAERLEKHNDALFYREKAARVKSNFSHKFWSEQRGYLYDVIDIPGKRPDTSLRPNQLLALSLPYPLIDDHERGQKIVDKCGQRLLTTYGLRTLDNDDVQYVGVFEGPQVNRDFALHQGTVWSWLIGPFVSAHLRVYQDPALARSFLEPFSEHLYAHGIGSISELFEGDPPHEPRGAIASAWGVAEILRVWHEIERSEADQNTSDTNTTDASNATV
jgi:predicted glycogen debranching enzyme